MVSIQNNQSIYTGSSYNTGIAGGMPFNQVQQASYSTDNFNGSLLANPNTAPPAADANKQAGFGKRFMNGLGNAFGKMADLVGLGTMSHYAKSNLNVMDTNKNNSLDINEFSAVSQMIGKTFQQVDSNANQEISLGEFKKVIGELVNAELKALDTSSDGFINYNEAAVAGYGNLFASHDTNQDSLLSRKEFAGLLNDIKIKKH